MTPLLLAQSFTPSTTSVAGNVFLTAIVGLLPLILFFVLMGVFKVATHWCASISLVMSLVIAVLAFKMPIGMALLAGTQGAAMGFMPIIYIIIAAVWLYNLTEKSGRSSDLKAVFNTIGPGSPRRLVLLRPARGLGWLRRARGHHLRHARDLGCPEDQGSRRHRRRQRYQRRLRRYGHPPDDRRQTRWR